MRGVIVGMMALLPSVAAGQEAGGTVKGQYEALAAELKAAMEGWEKQFELADRVDSPPAAKEARYRDWPGWAFAPRFVELAEFHPKDPAAVDALTQVVVELGRSVGSNDIALAPHYDRAVALLIRDHLDDDRLKEICRMVAKGLGPPCETLLRTAMEESKNRAVRGVACLGLAEYLLTKAEVAQTPWFDDPEKTRDPFARFLIARYDAAYLPYVRGSRPRGAYAESHRLLQRAAKEYADVVFWQDPGNPGNRRIVGEIASNLLKGFPVKVDVPAPEIEGDDLDGRPMKLSDHRGKVVVLAFWESGSPPSLAMVRGARSMVDRMRGRPFVLLGVNGDGDRRQAAGVVEEEKIPWRSWADGKPPGVIATRWEVRSWPAVYILDADGIIRHESTTFDEKAGFGEAFEKVLGEVLKEAERKGPSR